MTSRDAVASEPWDIGTDVQGYVWRAHSPRGAVLLQHGFNEYAERFVDGYSRAIPAFVTAGYSVYAFDLRGHGASGGRRGVVDVRRAITDHLLARAAVTERQLFLVGHSLGGLVTAGSAATSPSGIRGVVLLSPALPFGTPAHIRALSAMLSVAAPAAPAPVPSAPPSATSRVSEWIAATAADDQMGRGRLSNRVAYSAVQVARAIEQKAASWSAPTLIMHGTGDVYTDHRGSIALAEMIGAPDTTLRLVDGGFHELLNDLDASRTLAELLHWIGEHTEPGAS